jgi:hypothetical protein
MNVGNTMWVDWDGPCQIIVTGNSGGMVNIARVVNGQASNKVTDQYHGLTHSELNKMVCNKPKRFN